MIIDVNNYYSDLSVLAQKDLSLAHIKQHIDAAQLAVKIAGIENVQVAGYSSCKARDTVIYNQGFLTGKKLWVSNIPAGSHFVFGVKEENTVILVLVEITDQVKIEMVPTIGMESTFTGHMTFDHYPAVKLFEYNTVDAFKVKYQVALGFLTNHLGLCKALFNDIDQYTNQANIDCAYEKSKIKINLSAFKMLWVSCVEQAGSPESDKLWHQYNTAYAFAKQTLIMILNFVMQTTGSGLFEHGSVEHQRFKDALIYSSHMKNLYFSSKEHLYS